jgi:hypothetical protein
LVEKEEETLGFLPPWFAVRLYPDFDLEEPEEQEEQRNRQHDL